MNSKLSILILLSFSLISFSSCGQKSKEKKPEIMNEKPQAISLDKQLEVFSQLGYTLKEGVDTEMLIEKCSSIYDGEGDPITVIKNDRYALYKVISSQDADIDGYYLNNESFWYTLDYLEQLIAYEKFMERMGAITKGEVNFENIEMQLDANNIKWISFKVNGNQKRWHLGEGENVDDSFIQRFSHLPKELKTEGRYTICDQGGEGFIIDYATEEEQKAFNDKTNLNRIWLGEGPHFPEPKF